MNKSLHNQIAMVLVMARETVNNWIATVIFSYTHIFISQIHHFPRNIHTLNHIVVLILMPFINNITISWNL